MNLEFILIGALSIICTYGMILLAFKFFGKLGLFICVPVTIIIANIQVIVAVDMFGMALTLGNIAYVSSYLITDLLGELYSKKDAQQAVKIGFFALLSMVLIMNVMLLSAPYVTADSQVMFDSVNNIFSVMPRIMIASMISYLVSQTLDIAVYSKVKNKGDGSKLWLRNNVSTVTSQVVDGVVFTMLAFYGMFPFEVVIQIFISTFIVKAIIATLDTPFMYLGVKMHKENWINEHDFVRVEEKEN